MYAPILFLMRTNNVPVQQAKFGDQSDWVQLVKDSVDALKFGVVQIVVHNAKVVQIEKTEKVRLDPAN